MTFSSEEQTDFSGIFKYFIKMQKINSKIKLKYRMKLNKRKMKVVHCSAEPTMSVLCFRVYIYECVFKCLCVCVC